MTQNDPDCIFCRIVRGEIPAKAAYRDERVIAIEDVNPQAPVHLLVIPLDHYETLGDVVEAERDVSDALLRAATALGRDRGGAGGFRLVVNSGTEAGQTVGHAHVHVLAGRPMDWPPG